MDEVKVGDRVIVIECNDDGCVSYASTIQKIYPDKTFSDITCYDCEGIEYLEREEFITKKQAMKMLE